MSIEDLSEIHRPITSLFPSLKDDDFERYCLSSEEVDFFHDQGYLSGIQLLDTTQTLETNLKNEIIVRICCSASTVIVLPSLP